MLYKVFFCEISFYLIFMLSFLGSQVLDSVFFFAFVDKSCDLEVLCNCN